MDVRITALQQAILGGQSVANVDYVQASFQPQVNMTDAMWTPVAGPVDPTVSGNSYEWTKKPDGTWGQWTVVGASRPKNFDINYTSINKTNNWTPNQNSLAIDQLSYPGGYVYQNDGADIVFSPTGVFNTPVNLQGQIGKIPTA